ncbi:MAG: hypothetical protein QOE58_2671, partial [Actinomycetota bacterium]|nr:hypothetical protein [Actinomycetota bacterium]
MEWPADHERTIERDARGEVLAIRSGSTAFQRPVSPYERWLLAIPESQIEIIQLVVEGVGSVELEELTAAVEIASEANPGVRLERQGGKFVDSGNAPPVRQVGCVSTDPSQRVLDMPELQDILPTGAGPKCEVLLVASRSGITGNASIAG